MTNEELVALIKDGKDKTEHLAALWEQNRNYIAKIARRYSGIVEMDDLMQEGYLALCDAVNKYDPAVEVKFLSFATYCIRSRFVRYARGQVSIRVPEVECCAINKYSQAVQNIRMTAGREPTREEVKEVLGVSERELRKIERNALFMRISSLDSSTLDDENITISDSVADPYNGIEAAQARIEHEELKTALWGAVDSLPADQSAVIHAVYQQGKTLRSVSKEMGLSENKTYSIHEAGLRELRRGSRARVLLPLYNDYVYNTAVQGVGVGAFNRTWSSATERVTLYGL